MQNSGESIKYWMSVTVIKAKLIILKYFADRYADIEGRLVKNLL
jgi:hypothetical protein